MSIENEINRISTNVQETFNAIEEMGGTVPEGATSDHMAGATRTIPVGAKIDDAAPAADKTYSSQKIDGLVNELNEKNAAQDGRLTTLEQAGGIVTIEPANGDIPKVFIDGTIPTTKDDVLAEMTYISKSKQFHAYLKIKCQGTSSMSYPKKNFTIKLYSDEARETDMAMVMRDWGVASSKYVLKANYIDHAHARNIVSANLWSEIVESRADYDSLPEELRNSPNNGAIDGFPIKVYTNGTYQGIYTWNIGKDAFMWGMDEDNPNHVLMCAEGNTDGVYAETPSNFRALWNGVDGGKPGWSVEVGTNSTALKNSLNALIGFVMNNDGDAFKNGIGNHLDIQSAIDYYIFQYANCDLDGLAHNMLLATYDGTIWRCGAYDMDSTWGLWWNGAKFVAATYRCPEDYQEQFSLLWERIEALYYEEIKERYAELRGGVLSLPNIVSKFERFMDVIGLDLYAEDLTIYTSIPSGSTNNIKQIRDYARDRLAYVDAEIAALDAPAEEIPCTGITLDQNTLTFTAAGTQTLTVTVTPSNTTDVVIWSSGDDGVANVRNGVVTAVGNGGTTITATCGAHSATCTVSVSGIINPEDEPIDYSKNPLESVTWEHGMIYDGKNGADKTSSNDHRTSKFTLYSCPYKFVAGAGNSWPSIFIWNPNGAFVGSVSATNTFLAKAGYQYAIGIARTTDNDMSGVTLTPVNNEDTAIETTIDWSELEWTAAGGVRLEAKHSNDVVGTDINGRVQKSNYFVVGGVNANNPPNVFVEPIFYVGQYGGNKLIQTASFGTNVSALRTWLETAEGLVFSK